MATQDGIDRWISLELGRLNAGLVVEKKRLSDLRAEARAACRTRDGGDHPFERAALDRLAGVLPSADHDDLRLPITLIGAMDLRDSVVLSEALAAKALRAVEGFDAAFPFRDGRMYVPHSLALDIVRRSGGTVQLAFG